MHDCRSGVLVRSGQNHRNAGELAQDVSLLAFGWLTFIGSDIIIKSGGLIRIDMLSNRFPKAVQKTLMLVFDVFMLLFLLILIVYGFLPGIPELEPYL